QFIVAANTVSHRNDHFGSCTAGRMPERYCSAMSKVADRKDQRRIGRCYRRRQGTPHGVGGCWGKKTPDRERTLPKLKLAGAHMVSGPPGAAPVKTDEMEGGLAGVQADGGDGIG